MYKKIFFPLFLLLPLLLLLQPGPQSSAEDTFIVVGGGPPSIALYIDGVYVGGAALNDVWPNYTMYDAFLWRDKLVVTIAEVSKWIYIFHLPDFSRPAVVLRAPGNVSHFLYYKPEVAPLEGSTLWLAVFNTTEKRGYICALDLSTEVIQSCVPVGVYPHAPVKLGTALVTPLIREPYVVYKTDGGLKRRLVTVSWPPYVNAHDKLRYSYFSFHMVTTDGRYIYGEGHTLEPGYLLSPISIHSHTYLVTLSPTGEVISYYPTSALPPGLPGLAVCRGKLFATSPLEGAVYVMATPHLKPLSVIKLGKAPWGVFANRDCSRVYVTDIIGGEVYVIDVDTLSVVKRFTTPMAWPHTVIFIDGAEADMLKPAVSRVFSYNFTYFPPLLACGDLPPS
ncbi:YncE family protein [Pyrobaculum ferrireducens]|uniref:YncE family protein n=1 Tax=Pyrobaculum ferrireducens TaxID=1104324 RepID=G7VHH4_9CREN|nr:hypothetical protein [Pyrobaculum ferrireducens]AET33265.1 hypothetical protein P186_1863 [Pyrobaculum ferrireducens]